MVFGSCGAVCPLFVSIGEMKKVVVTQRFVSLSFKTLIENNVQ